MFVVFADFDNSAYSEIFLTGLDVDSYTDAVLRVGSCRDIYTQFPVTQLNKEI